ncbi:hypothetical protein THAOC_20452 [Thalassiosira oceanica]|uniref:Uncharacterized protein n=1 Tax=Thalassiosira oceanica TaxID=159749 RepID=K0SEH1_THAOC|nr:hypothetical protein THAOC_20452 [Thalassiosira oceanica]|eukprot:EJK59341.1 hypothetical protein THAOC_20452 [Thalassiosira oceanica]
MSLVSGHRHGAGSFGGGSNSNPEEPMAETASHDAAAATRSTPTAPASRSEHGQIGGGSPINTSGPAAAAVCHSSATTVTAPARLAAARVTVAKEIAQHILTVATAEPHPAAHRPRHLDWKWYRISTDGICPAAAVAAQNITWSSRFQLEQQRRLTSWGSANCIKRGSRPAENELAAALSAEAHSGSLAAHRLFGGVPSLWMAKYTDFWPVRT